MVSGRVGRSMGARLVPCAAMILALAAASSPAEARGRHWVRSASAHHAGPTHARSIRHPAGHGSAVAAGAGPNFAAMVVDANSGETLYAVNEDEPRHPASITKVMTLYLLFEALEQGRLRLDSPLAISEHAAEQAPSKLGLRPGSTIAVESAIKAVVTKSANDIAVAIAENLAGDEDSFARAMTEKARALGMSHTFYHNASGLPDMRQITTARDLTILGRQIRERFPRFYHYFSIPSFSYAGKVMPNHNHLMARVDGMDGIKTGYTVASGFNLLSSVNRGGRRLVSVVLGGRSAASRDTIMASLIETHIEEASATPRTRVASASPIEEPAETPAESRPTEPVERLPPRGRQALAQADETDDLDAGPVERAPPGGRLAVAEVEDGPEDGPVERQPPRGPNLIAPDLALPAVPPPRPADRARFEAPRPGPAKSQDRPRPAFIAGAPQAAEGPGLPPTLTAAERRRLSLDGSTNRRTTASNETTATIPTATPSSLRWVTGAAPARLGPSVAEARAPGPAKARDLAPGPSSPRGPAASETRGGRAESGRAEDARGSGPAPAKGGWVIQIGATDDAGKANDLLARARSEGRSALGSARGFTEKVQKGEATLYRARFAGLDPQAAEAACRTLKQSGFACFATRD